jgi:dTDP-glucose pyrophosphorylase
MKPNQTWKKTIICSNATIKEAIQILNEVGLRIAIVVSESGEFLGIISDGDIRRGMVKGFSLNDSIKKILKSKPLVASEGLSKEKVLQLMLDNKVHQIPILDSKNKIVGLHLWDELNLNPKRSNLFLIMAGGKGTRLMPFTEECPKSLVKIGDKPMIEHIIDRAKRFGYKNYIISIYHFGEMIKSYLGNGNRLNINLSYIQESSPLGTAGSLSLLSDKPKIPIIVTNGDVISDIDYGEILDFHMHNEAVATMAVTSYQWQNPFGVVNMDGIVISGFEEKPIIKSYINAGVYVLSPIVIDYLRPGVPCDMPELFERLRQDSKKIVAYPMHEPWLDVGRPIDLEKANAVIYKGKK